MQFNRKHVAAKWFGIALVLVLVLAVAAGCGKKKDEGSGASASPTPTPFPDDMVVATYKDGKITGKEFNKFLHTTFFFYPQYAAAEGDPGFNDYMVKQMLTLRVLGNQASDANKKDAETKAKEQIVQIKDYFESQEKGSWDKQLKESKLEEKDVQDYMQSTLAVMSDMTGKVTDQEAKDNYDKALKTDAHVFDVATVSHILVALKDPNDSTGQKDLRTKEEALKRAQEVKGKLDAGGDFVALAKEYSDDPGSKDNGGKYENEELATSGWDPDFLKAAQELTVGKISDPVETSFGYHIMLVNSRSSKTFDQMKDEMKSEVAGTKINDFVENELPKLDFKSNLPQPSPSPSASPSASASPAASVSPSASASPSPSAK